MVGQEPAGAPRTQALVTAVAAAAKHMTLPAATKHAAEGWAPAARQFARITADWLARQLTHATPLRRNLCTEIPISALEV